MIFVDTSFWAALMVPRERLHADAGALLERHGHDRLVTTNHVRGEVWTLLRRRAGHRVAAAAIERLDAAPRLGVAFVSEEIEREALDWLRRHDERPYSFVDATSFALMRSLRIGEALAFDEDFTAAGFVELRP